MQKSKQKYHISMEKYNIKKGLIVYTCIVLVFGGCIQAINDKYIKEQEENMEKEPDQIIEELDEELEDPRAPEARSKR